MFQLHARNKFAFRTEVMFNLVKEAAKNKFCIFSWPGHQEGWRGKGLATKKKIPFFEALKKQPKVRVRP